jgi:hypothetical protein
MRQPQEKEKTHRGDAEDAEERGGNRRTEVEDLRIVEFPRVAAPEAPCLSFFSALLRALRVSAVRLPARTQA